MLDQIISLLGCFVSRFTCRDQALLTYGDEIRSLRAELVAVSADGQAVDLRDEREKYQKYERSPGSIRVEQAAAEDYISNVLVTAIEEARRKQEKISQLRYQIQQLKPKSTRLHPGFWWGGLGLLFSSFPPLWFVLGSIWGHGRPFIFAQSIIGLALVLPNVWRQLRLRDYNRRYLAQRNFLLSGLDQAEAAAGKRWTGWNRNWLRAPTEKRRRNGPPLC